MDGWYLIINKIKSSVLRKFQIILCLAICYLVNNYHLAAQDILMLKNDGKVLIGDPNNVDTSADYKLFVQEGILTERVKVALKSTANWSDHAFDQTPSLDVVEKSIKQNSHLHDMPSAQYLVDNGYEVQRMDAKLLAQIEWLWQHTLRIQKEKQTLESELSDLKTLVKEMSARLEAIEDKK